MQRQGRIIAGARPCGKGQFGRGQRQTESSELGNGGFPVRKTNAKAFGRNQNHRSPNREMCYNDLPTAFQELDDAQLVELIGFAVAEPR
jgi:hypothetical protein